MDDLSDRYRRECYVCEQGGEDLVYDEDALGHRHEGCTLSSVAARLPVLIRDLEIGIQTAEQELLGDPFTSHPYRQAWVGLRTVARQALEELQGLEIPPMRTVDQVVDEIIAEGHTRVSLERWPWRSNEPWECSSRLDGSNRGQDEAWDAYEMRSHRGSAEGASALEVATKRLEQIRAGKGLAVFFGFFLPDPVDVKIRDAKTCADRSGLSDDGALPDQIEEI